MWMNLHSGHRHQIPIRSMAKNNPEFKSKEIKQTHREIAESLYKMLSNKYRAQNMDAIYRIIQEHIDMVRKEAGQYIFYEIKTYNQLRKIFS